MINYNFAGLRQFERSVVAWAEGIVDEAVEETRPHIHVITGRLQASFRRDSRVREGKMIVIRMTAGGVRLRGIFKEVDKERDVDYAMFEEMRHPQIRTFAIPAVIRRVRQ